MKYSSQYYILKNKKPWPNFSTTHRLEDISDATDVGAKLQYPYVVVDIDDADSADYLADVLDAAGIVYGLMYTTKGSHFWFKSEVPLKNVIKKPTLLNISIDIKSWGKNGQVKIKSDGEFREWVYQPDLEDMSTLPEILMPITTFMPPLIPDGRGERHDYLLNLVFPLAGEGFTPRQIYRAFKFLNSNIMAAPLDEHDIRAMTTGNPKLTTESFYTAGKLNSNAVSIAVRAERKMHLHSGVLWVYDYAEHRYKLDDLAIETEIHKLLPHLTSTDRKEIIKKIILNMNMMPSGIQDLGKHEVVVANGILNMSSGRLRAHDETVFSTTALNTRYTPRAQSDVLDNFMRAITQNDPDLELLLYQVVGYSLVAHCDYQTAFMLAGEGSNGKSTFLDMFIKFLNRDNVSTVPLNGLKDPNKVARLINKFVNVGDDIGKRLEETETFKSLVAGMPVDVKLLYREPFSYVNTAKLIYSANELPQSKDRSGGYYRRWTIIPFDATFLPGDPTYDPHLSEKLDNESVREALLCRAVEAYKLLHIHKKFTEPTRSMAAKDNYRAEGDSVYAWLLTNPAVVGSTKDEAYNAYVYWASVQGYRHTFEMKTFNKKLPILMPGLQYKNTTRRGRQTYVWVMT